MEMHLFTGNIICCIYFLIHLSAIAIFLKGFFPMKTVLPGYSTLNDSCFSLLDHCCKDGDESEAKCFQEPVFGRLVIVLVDALRADFVLPKDDHNVYERGHQEAKDFSADAKMSFVHNLILEQEAVAFCAKTNPPTVTLPRIKAMTTGAIPGFVDVILNFNSSSLLDDSFVMQFYNNGRNLVFYGDETWLRLFPGHFIRSDGTTSFFVTDYTEVDNNVTRHLHSELNRDDWDVMILHYLGLDHIGHIAGPKSPLISPKLQEMDDIVKMLHQTFVDQDKSKTLPTLLVLCGDHGMSDQGGHGGSTPSEIFTPVVFMSSLYQHGHGVPFRGQVINQIDLAATLSLVLGHPIPKNSFGILTMDVLGHLDLEKKLKAAFINAQQLKNVAAESHPNFELGMTHAQLNMVNDLHQKWIGTNRNSENSVNQGKIILSEYNEVMREMQDMLASSKSLYDLHAMSFGIFLLVVIFFTSLLHFWCSITEISVENYQWPMPCTFLCALAVLLHLFVCTRPNCSLFLCSGYALLLSILLLSLALFLFLYILLLSAFVWKILHLIRVFVNQVFTLKQFRYLGLWPGVVLHSVSLLSSSFVEEEHQTWYFLTVTVLLAFWGYFAFHYLASLLPHWQDATGKNEGVMFDHLQNPRYSAGRNVEKLDPKEDYYCQLTDRLHPDTDEKLSKAKDKNISSGMKCSYLWLLLSCLICAALCRVARSWNQTGDKWSHLSDVGDWLIRPDSKVILSAVCALSLLVVCIATALKTRDTWIRICFLSGALGVYWYHSVTGSILLPYLYHGTIHQGITEARVVYLFVAILAFRAASKVIWSSFERDENDKKLSSRPTDSNNKILRKKASGTALSDDRTLLTVGFWTDVLILWTLLMLLLMRAHNLPLVAIAVVQSSCLNLVLKGLRGILNTSSLVIFYLWMGQAAFYYQGNSNSLATINLAVGYTGLESYQPFIVGFQIGLATYSGPIFWILALMKSLSELQLDPSIMFRRKWRSYAASTFYFTTLISRLIVLIPYLIGAFIQRYHLFVWTVFSPKLLYEGVHSIICTVLVLFVMGINRFIVCL